MTDYQHHARNDQWIAEVIFPGVRDAYFVEAGACGGIRQSATYVLETELGWDGICVEPLDEYYELLRDRRSCSTDSRCLSSTSGGLVEFVCFAEEPARSGIRETNKSNMRAVSRGHHSTTTTKETVTLSDLLVQHDAPDTVHYLNLDVEGAEIDILASFDFATDRQILALSIEGRDCNELLASFGYLDVSNSFAIGIPDQYFVHPSLRSRLPHLFFQ